ncbi:hypothetical protein KPH14_007373 [Odynerus spinipes]|uniref:Gem-associated protein 6 n=1 Tax=Odynerus spinipes TaxID=1348599 RepID=A0AAD9RBK4_9HYME|nr:hypothetical protein KPH14_007373 [Odynerus spinipes]
MCSPKKDLTKFVHNTHQKDPLAFKSFIGTEVKVKTDNTSVHTGILYTMDPVSGSVVLLCNKEDNRYNLQLVFGHAIKEIEYTTKTKTHIPELFQNSTDQFSLSDLTKKKNIVKQHLLENRFPVTDVNDILYIEDSVSIKPPYTADHCVCTNSIILSRIQNILRSVKK